MPSLAERLGDPEQVIADLNRRRHMKVFGVIVGMVLGIGAMLALSAAMYSDEPSAAPPPIPAEAP